MLFQFLNGDLLDLPDFSCASTHPRRVRKYLRKHADRIRTPIAELIGVHPSRIRICFMMSSSTVPVLILDRPCVDVTQWFGPLKASDILRGMWEVPFLMHNLYNQFRYTSNVSILRYLLQCDTRRMLPRLIRERLYQNPHPMVVDHLLTRHPTHPHRLLHVGRRARMFLYGNPSPSVREFLGPFSPRGQPCPLQEDPQQIEDRLANLRRQVERWELNSITLTDEVLTASSSDIHAEWLIQHAEHVVNRISFHTNEHPFVVHYLLENPHFIQFPCFLKNSHPDAVQYSISYLRERYGELEDIFNTNPTLCQMYRQAIHLNRHPALLLMVQQECRYLAHDNLFELLTHLARIPDVDVVVERSNQFV